MKTVTLFTDGGCHGNPGPGGWAAILRYGNRTRELSGGCPATTNNRMEIQAAIAGLSALREPCEVAVHTDSQYLRQGISQWIFAWRARGWMTASRRPVKNADLWKELDAVTRRHKVSWHWLKGHAGHEDNERCDLLAAEEIAKIRNALSPEDLARHLKEFVEQAGDQGGELF